MKLVIEIPDEVYSHAKDIENRLLTPNEESVLRDSVVNGTPLPKGHGRIADIDKVLEEMRATRTYDIPFALERVKPIIESDGSNKDEVNNWICQML